MIKLIAFALIVFQGAAFADTNPSIFHLRVPGGDFQLLDKAAFPKPYKEESNIIKIQRRMCQQGTGKKCLYFADRMGGTAFVFGQGNMIATSLHTFAEYLHQYWALNNQNTNIPVPVQLIKDGGDVVYGGRAGDIGYITKISETARQRLEDGTQPANEEEDFVMIKLVREMGPVLVPAKNEVTTGQAVLVDGFVNHRDVNEWTSNGNIVSNTVLGLIDKTWWDCGFSEVSWRLLKFANYANDRGLSGAPVLNETGEVLGIHTGYCNTNRISFFIPISQLLKTL